MNAPHENLARLQDIDRKHHLHPFTDQMALRETGTRIIQRGEGVWLWDVEGNRFLDGMAGLWCVNIGYGRPELVEAATRQMTDLAYYNCFFGTSTPAATRLSELLAQVAPDGLTQSFFTNSGSEANDTVLRFARHYWALRGKQKKTIFISRRNAYHGSSIAAASLGGMAWMHSQGGLPIPDIAHISQPYVFGEAGNEDPEAFGRRVAQELEEKIRELGPDRVAAFIAEPVQGSGGVIVPPASYWPEIKRICAENEILLVADEVICGFGRTGKWFGSDYYGLKPDMMSMAKGISSGYLPLGAVMMSDEIANTLAAGGFLSHGFTYSGHPVACAVAVRNIEILRDERIVEHVEENAAPRFASEWGSLADHPLVGEARTLGLLGALELVAAKADRQRFTPERKAGLLLREAGLRHGVIVRSIGDTIVASPPLIISDDEIVDLVRRLRLALDDTATALGNF